MGVGFVPRLIENYRNFIILAKKDKNNKIENIAQAKQEMEMTKEQQKEAKVILIYYFLSDFQV